MERKLTLHIGFGKTGTTALQQFFVDNSKRLAAHGIHYPRSGRGSETAHHYIATAARPGGGTGYESKESWETQLSRLINEINNYNLPNVLISSEVLSGRIIWRKLNDFHDYFNDITVVIYMRRQDDLIMSSHQQWIKDSTYSVDYSEMDVLPYFFDEAIDTWRTYLKPTSGTIVARPYERSQFVGGTIFSDFMMHAFGIDNLSGWVFPKAKATNPRLSERALEFKRRLNRICPADIVADLLSHLLDYSASDEVRNDKRKWDTSIFPPAARRKFMREMFDAGNERVAREILNRGDGMLFINPLPADDEDWTPPTLSVDDALDIGRFLLRLKYSGAESQKVEAILNLAHSADDPVASLIVALVWELYGRRIDGRQVNPIDPVVHPRLKEKIAERRAKLSKVIIN